MVSFFLSFYFIFDPKYRVQPGHKLKTLQSTKTIGVNHHENIFYSERLYEINH